ncbi:hypothetical protein [Nocardioides sp. CFH 31398]|uniref:T3SS (YopN, CesT) and YbjN peptide-binding chaperone 1 n=1 Tax=Nocardioides sp. CFH 31398 TaxID=2919579 RepID=UPI001F05ADEB|nr:hypothetical protein [Nocardioides sp. CFH 31398]MCH1867603.1 hypothetical protein [Nocardioides sp. CFH 31398]
MDEQSEQRWDDEVEAAWTAFRRGLGDRLAALEQEESLSVALRMGEDDDERVAPHCEVTAWGGHVLTVEVSPDALLAPGDRIGPEGEARLRGLGFTAVGPVAPGLLQLTVDQREADRAAWVVTAVLRTVLGVLHPALLQDDESSPGDGHETSGEEPVPGTVGARDEHWPTDDDGPWFPGDSEDVRRALHRVARDLLGDEPVWDADDDLAIATDHAQVWVVVASGAPRVLLTSTLLTEVVDESRALVEANLLNRRHFGLTFLLDDRRLVVRRELGVSAFQPADVRAELARLVEQADRWVVELRERVGGRGVWDDAGSAPLAIRGPGDTAGPDDAQQSRFVAAQDVARELEREQRGSADPATLARVYHHDRALVMLAVAATRAREAEHRRRAEKHQEAERPSVAKRFRAAARYERELRSRLRRALRITVQAGQRPETSEQPGLFAEEDVRG